MCGLRCFVYLCRICRCKACKLSRLELERELESEWPIGVCMHVMISTNLRIYKEIVSCNQVINRTNGQIFYLFYYPSSTAFLRLG